MNERTDRLQDGLGASSIETETPDQDVDRDLALLVAATTVVEQALMAGVRSLVEEPILAEFGLA